ncbi:hypothetical protein DFJ73DRAFT_554249 [Zopfochytrium polystomum]|nr:hypothetical protein DFJ73DRAFT_554249 [Zopfochytrium polystomum]
MRGFSDTKDRRLLDPPPILQLFVRQGKDQERTRASSLADCATLVCHASLWSPNGLEDRSVVSNPRSGGSNSSGARSATPASQRHHHQHTARQTPGAPYSDPTAPSFSSSKHPHKTHLNQPAGGSTSPPRYMDPWSGSQYHPQFSAVPDWRSVDGAHPVYAQTSGETNVPPTPPRPHQASSSSYQSHLYVKPEHNASTSPTRTSGSKLSSTATRRSGSSGSRSGGSAAKRQGPSNSKAVAWTDVFEVFSPKAFPGMTESTELSRAFARQGVPHPHPQGVRLEPRAARAPDPAGPARREHPGLYPEQ